MGKYKLTTEQKAYIQRRAEYAWKALLRWGMTENDVKDIISQEIGLAILYGAGRYGADVKREGEEGTK